MAPQLFGVTACAWLNSFTSEGRDCRSAFGKSFARSKLGSTGWYTGFFVQNQLAWTLGLVDFADKTDVLHSIFRQAGTDYWQLPGCSTQRPSGMSN